jgi:hypothetical protein
MTGSLDRLRAWIDGVLGGTDEGSSPPADAPERPDAGRDDRPARVETPVSGAESAGSSTTDAAADSSGTVTCSVCGTTVDDPSAPCPLCRSTDVGPTGVDGGGTGTPGGSGHTVVSTGDDEAVERLRDVRDGE